MGSQFQGAKDVNFARKINRELYIRFMRVVDVYIYDRGAGDPLYGESVGTKTFSEGTDKPTYSVEAYFPQLPNWKEKLTKLGLDSERSMFAYFFYDTFLDLGVKPPDTGDHIVVQNERYKVMQSNPKDYFINTQVPMTYEVLLTRYRPTSLPEGPRALEDSTYPPSQLKIVE